MIVAQLPLDEATAPAVDADGWARAARRFRALEAVDGPRVAVLEVVAAFTWELGFWLVAKVGPFTLWVNGVDADDAGGVLWSEHRRTRIGTEWNARARREGWRAVGRLDGEDGPVVVREAAE